MTTVLHLGAIAAYAALAAIVAWLLPGAIETRVLAGATVLLAAAILHEVIARGAERREWMRELACLRKAQSSTAAQASNTESSLAEMQAAIGYGGDGSAPDLLGEMRTIRGLLKRMTDRSAAVRERAEGVLARASAADPVAEKLTDAQVLDILRSALEANRVDLHLQPIVGLPQRKVRYYEAFGRVRTENGTVLLPDQYRAVAAMHGLLPRIDNLQLFRCVQSVRRAWKEKLEVGFFCNLSREALLDAEFFEQFIEFLEGNKDLSQSLVFELSQDDALDARLNPSLSAMRKLGFVLSMDKIPSLGLDLDDIARRNIRFLKIDAEQLRSREAQAHLTIHIADFGEKLKRAGISLVAEKVEKESQVLGLLDLNVTFAQGYLFGEPRPLREQA